MSFPAPPTVLILGATSGIAQALARRLARRGAHFHLVARDGQKLGTLAADLRTRGAGDVQLTVAALDDPAAHPELIRHVWHSAAHGFDLSFLAFGTLPDQQASLADWQHTERALRVNLLAPISLLHALAPLYRARGRGCLAAISSVAGDRGRLSNFTYGTAKAGLSAYLQGLRADLSRSGVQVLTVKPGFVDTPMTAHLKKGPLFTSADQAAGAILKAIDARRDEVYVPGFWRAVMAVIRHVPEQVFKRLPL